MALKRQSSTPHTPTTHPPTPPHTKIHLQCGGHNNFSHVEPPSLSGVLLKLTSAYSRKQQQNNNNNNSKNSNTHFINIPSLFARHNQHRASSGMCQPPCSFGAESRTFGGCRQKKKKRRTLFNRVKQFWWCGCCCFSPFFSLLHTWPISAEIRTKATSVYTSVHEIELSSLGLDIEQNYFSSGEELPK